jgi:hypothetical protein
MGGASIFRVHDIAEHVTALRVFHALHCSVAPSTGASSNPCGPSRSDR